MNIFNIKISAKISLGFGFITLALIINAVIISNVLDKTRLINDKINNVYQPSRILLIKIEDEILNSKLLVQNFILSEKKIDNTDSQAINYLHTTTFPGLKKDLTDIAEDWDQVNRKELHQILSIITDSLFKYQNKVIDNKIAYSKEDVQFQNVNLTDLASDYGKIGLVTAQIKTLLDQLIDIEHKNVISSISGIDSYFIQLKKNIIYTCIALIIISLITANITIRGLVVPITYIKNILLSMSRGVLPKDKIKEGSDEIGEMSKALNQLVYGLKNLSSFALEIGRGNYNSKFNPLSEDDVIGNSLLRMRDDLKSAAIEEAKRKLEDEHRNWASSGIAKFSDILRKNNDQLDILSYNIISNLVQYLEANQGGIFIINDNDIGHIYIEMLACYAYNHKKYLQKNLEMGEGLVGRCIKERETIYLTDIPNDYIKIKSGLGKANPKSLLLVPLAMNEYVFGVIELASFLEIQPYQIEFVEKIADSIASTLSTVKINIQTTKLLEQSRIQAEELASQEEEMRQNMEELRATQEQSSRKEEELRHALEAMQKQINEQ